MDEIDRVSMDEIEAEDAVSLPNKEVLSLLADLAHSDGLAVLTVLHQPDLALRHRRAPSGSSTVHRRDRAPGEDLDRRVTTSSTRCGRYCTTGQSVTAITGWSPPNGPQPSGMRRSRAL